MKISLTSKMLETRYNLYCINYNNFAYRANDISAYKFLVVTYFTIILTKFVPIALFEVEKKFALSNFEKPEDTKSNYCQVYTNTGIHGPEPVSRTEKNGKIFEWSPDQAVRKSLHKYSKK